jgi:hypothetical protein
LVARQVSTTNNVNDRNICDFIIFPSFSIDSYAYFKTEDRYSQIPFHTNDG